MFGLGKAKSLLRRTSEDSEYSSKWKCGLTDNHLWSIIVPLIVNV